MKSSKLRDNIEDMIREYENIEIPQELEITVISAIEGSKSEKYKESIIMNKNRKIRGIKSIAGIAAAAALLFTGAVNISPAFADSVAEIPLIGSLVRVINFSQHSYDEGTYNAEIQTPIIEGMDNEELQKSLNSRYIDENKDLFEQFEKEVAQMEEFADGGHLGVDSGFVIKTDNDQILSIGRYVVNTVGSSSTQFRYDTIDKKNEVMITLPSLFRDESYIDVISSNIKEQMKQQMKEDENRTYWLKGETEIMGDEGFEKIAADQQFYINEDSKLVISFDKYEVAPGYMGVIEFVIPTEKIQEILAGNLYIR